MVKKVHSPRAGGILAAQTSAPLSGEFSAFVSNPANGLYCFACSSLDERRSTDFLDRFVVCSASSLSCGIFGGMIAHQNSPGDGAPTRI